MNSIGVSDFLITFLAFENMAYIINRERIEKAGSEYQTNWGQQAQAIVIESSPTDNVIIAEDSAWSVQPSQLYGIDSPSGSLILNNIVHTSENKTFQSPIEGHFALVAVLEAKLGTNKSIEPGRRKNGHTKTFFVICWGMEI